MNARRVVIALGGNALLDRTMADTAEAMRASADVAAGVIAEIASQGWEVVITHGNGPQVGRILLQNETAKAVTAAMPLDVCGAQSQGQIGFLLVTAIRNTFKEKGLDRPVVNILTLTRVRSDDPAFQHPAKPIGPYYGRAQARRMARDFGYHMSPLGSGDGNWRRTVPSPRPCAIEQAPEIVGLVRSGATVIACGGGGVPVVEIGSRLVGVEAVVDKDLAACILAQTVHADTLLILTDVDGVYRGYGTPQQERLSTLTVSQARSLLAQDGLGTGSMGPKIDAAASFTEATGSPAYIARLADGARALSEHAGTRITADHSTPLAGPAAEQRTKTIA
ncbi:MAG TPA: carbamate kinase [Actinocrinis sp.]|uniref:carbamate kinase n=1 Tax=Actinocrinis sp. TaxID=1920516 RepID=UPI002DDCE6A0|nr:carbamate kinase [Actinocrinis sp.]HEV3169649.1 carbamate kinase [Actinocrinis sp.]